MNPMTLATGVAIDQELMRARRKFPTNEHLMVALAEEVGELAQAMLQGYDKQRVYDEAKQVACVAIRIMEEGDGEFLK